MKRTTALRKTARMMERMKRAALRNAFSTPIGDPWRDYFFKNAARSNKLARWYRAGVP